MLSSQLFDESILIRKQREEIILLTNKLKSQEIQLNAFNQENSNVKSSINVYEKKHHEADCHMKVYENQIKELKSKSFYPITSLLLDLFFRPIKRKS